MQEPLGKRGTIQGVPRQNNIDLLNRAVIPSARQDAAVASSRTRSTKISNAPGGSVALREPSERCRSLITTSMGRLS